ncbi:MAG: vitamin K epoxide reductase family protein [Nanoarchaeota archaeon]|nr:vitamin K epoxide reductase family protein [Nanoarchaeota archaeon]
MPIYLIILIIASIIGLATSTRLLYTHKEMPFFHRPKRYPSKAVTDTKWAYTFYVRNEIIGAAYYIMALIISISAIFQNSIYGINLSSLIFLASIPAVLFSIFLFYVQSRILKKYCPLCLTASSMNLVILAASLILVLKY